MQTLTRKFAPCANFLCPYDTEILRREVVCSQTSSLPAGGTVALTVLSNAQNISHVHRKQGKHGNKLPFTSCTCSLLCSEGTFYLQPSDASAAVSLASSRQRRNLIKHKHGQAGSQTQSSARAVWTQTNGFYTWGVRGLTTGEPPIYDHLCGNGGLGRDPSPNRIYFSAYLVPV